jgi:hypothetical protein
MISILLLFMVFKVGDTLAELLITFPDFGSFHWRWNYPRLLLLNPENNSKRFGKYAAAE